MPWAPFALEIDPIDGRIPMIATPPKCTAPARGFTLIELMIVVAIVAVVVGLAVPSLSRHIVKAQVSRVHAELSHYRTPIDEILLTGDQSVLAADAKSAVNFVDSDLSDVVFGTFADPGASRIVGTLNGRASSFVHGTTVTLSRDARGSWTCTVVGNGSGWSDRLVPNACE